MIQPPAAGEDVRLLHRKVEECIDVLNALMNMQGVIEGRMRLIGKLTVGSSSSELKFTEGTEIGTIGT